VFKDLYAVLARLQRRLAPRFALSTRPRSSRRWLLAAAMLGLLAAPMIGWLQLRSPAVPDMRTVSFSEVASALDAHAVTTLSIEAQGTRVVATLAGPRRIGAHDVRVMSAVLPLGAVSLPDLERWGATGADVRVRDDYGTPGIAVRLVSILALLGGVGLVVFLSMRRSAPPKGRFAVAPLERQLTMADVGGAAEARADLRDVIAYLREPARFRAMGARCPAGVLLVGPPGTGKTLLARAVAGEANCPVIVASGSEFTETFVGVGARRVRELAAKARAAAPCIVFIDEFDSLGGRRGRPNRSGEEETTLNQLLVEMDGMVGSDDIVWMAATNRDDMLDPAVLRPGRFDRVVEVALPTTSERLEILRVHAMGRPLAPDVDLDRLAAVTVGYAGAELAKLLNEAAILAVHDEEVAITMAHVEQARDRMVLGRVRAGVVISEAERRLVALHEAGHAIVGLLACPQDRLHKVTIEPRGRSLGAAHYAPDADRHLYSRGYLTGVIAKALGGRAAELVFLGADAVTSGAGSDLVQATSIARRMVGEFGMSSEVGLVSVSPAAGDGRVSAQLDSQVDSAVRALMAEQAARAESLVREHRAAVEALAEALLAREVLLADDVHAIARRHGLPVPRCAELVAA
jgi:cell division protease FtsH